VLLLAGTLATGGVLLIDRFEVSSPAHALAAPSVITTIRAAMAERRKFMGGSKAGLGLLAL